MELTNNNDVLIVLNITDRRGRNIRIAAVKDIKVKVWTQDPECALTFNYRDIIQKMDCDVIAIPSRQMAALPSGIVVYQYQFKGMPDEPHNGFHPQIERCHTVTTDIFWKNNRHEDFMKNPTFYNSLDYLKEMIEREHRERHHQYGDLYHYVTETYTNKLQDEVDRATARENDLEESINNISGTIESNYSELKDKIDAEVKRSTEVDIHFLEIINELDSKTQDGKQEVEDKLDSESQRAEEAEKVLQSNIDAETERAKTEEKRIEEKLDAEIARAKAEDVQTHLEIETETTRAKQEEARIEGKIDAEAARAKEAEKHIQTDVDDEIKRAKGREDELDKKQKELSEAFDTLRDDVKDEIKRSKEFDEKCEETCKKNTEKVDSLESALTDEIARAKKKEKNIKQQIEDETSRATIAENEIKASIDVMESTHKAELSRIEGKADAEAARAKEAEKHIQSDIDDEIARAKAREDELNNSITSNTTKIADLDERLEAAIQKEKKDYDNLNQSLQMVVNASSNALEAEVKRSKTEEARIEGKVDHNTNLIQNEQSRAELVEKDITESLQALKALVNSKDTELKGSIDGLRDELYAEIQRSETEDSNINRLVEILNGDEDTVGSVLHSIKDAEHRINDNIEDLRDEVEEIIGGNLEDYATKIYVDERFQHLIGEAPEALDTLEEIANKLKQDDEIFATLQEILSGKAAKDDVYTKGEIDRQTADLSNAVQTETQRATLAENGLQSQIDALNSDAAALTEKVNQHIAAGDANYQEVYNAIVKEQTRAENEETKLQNSIDVINGDENTIGSIAHAVSDLGHEFDDKIASLKLETSETLKEYAKQFDLDALSTTVNNHIADADSRYAELNNAIVAEVTRATNAETINANAIAVINGDENQIGSIKHAEADANHYTDDRIAEIKGNIDVIESNLNSHIEDANAKYDELKGVIDTKQDKGDYVEYTTDETNRKHIILPNNVNIVGTLQDGTDGRNLIMLSKWNVTDVGSTNCPINLNGLNGRPTYNDSKEIALLEDVEGVSTELKQRIEEIETMLQWGVYE